MFTQLNDLKTRYERRGDDGTPVLLIMGFGITCDAWAPQTRALSPHHKVAYYDNRGIGQSEPSPTPYALWDLADDAAALLDHLEWPTAHVVGVSMGGMIAQHLALRHTARMRSLTLIATHAGGSPHRWFPRPGGLRLFLTANTRAGHGRLEALRHLLYTPAYAARADFRDAGAEDFGEGGLEAFSSPADRKTLLYQLGAIARHHTGHRLGELDHLPTLLIKPEQDRLVHPTATDFIREKMPNSDLLSIGQGGHGVTHERADLVNAHILAHLGRVDAQTVTRGTSQVAA